MAEHHDTLDLIRQDGQQLPVAGDGLPGTSIAGGLGQEGHARGLGRGARLCPHRGGSVTGEHHGAGHTCRLVHLGSAARRNHRTHQLRGRGADGGIDERDIELHVDLHGPGTAGPGPGGQGTGAGDGRPPGRLPAGPGSEPQHADGGGTEDPQLVAGLVRPRADQGGGPVCGQ